MSSAALASYQTWQAKEQSTDIATTLPKFKGEDKVYYVAKVTYPGAKVYYDSPLTLSDAKIRLTLGYDVYAKTSTDAEKLCIAVGGGFTGPTRDSNPQNAMHYHPLSYVGRGHVFFGYDANLNFVKAFE